MQNVQRQQLAMAMAEDPTVLRKFKTGFNECAREVSTYISQIDERNGGLKDRITGHLGKCMYGIEQIARFNFPGVSATSPFLSKDVNIYATSDDRNETPVVDDRNKNSRARRAQNIKLIPSRLPSGELAFLLPHSNNVSSFSGLFGENENLSVSDLNPQTQRCGAFATVMRTSTVNRAKSLSSPPSPTEGHLEDRLPTSTSSNVSRSPSPKGFRPVNRTLQKSYRSAFLSTVKLGYHVAFNGETDYQQHATSKDFLDNDPDKKIIEPLCIITNRSERFKQAQVLDDTIDCVENRHRIKKKFESTAEIPCRLLQTVSDDRCYHYTKDLSTFSGFNSDQSERYNLSIERPRENEIENGVGAPSTSQVVPQNNPLDIDNNIDMWRPW